jgi:macrodomain Ter protein organizer (MatP/YcbG family)
MTVRKNFLLNEEIVEYLKKLAEQSKLTQTQVIKNLIEEQYEKIAIAEKLESLKKFAGSGTGLFREKTVQSIKANMDV